MAAKSKARQVVHEAEEEARCAALAIPRLPGEHEDFVRDPGHEGHRTHFCGNAVICSCGAFRGTFSIALTGDEASTLERCPVCVARGIA
jgi:hypothetical protein